MAFKLIFKGGKLVWRNHILLTVELSSRKSLVLFDEHSDNSIWGGGSEARCKLCTRLLIY